MKESMKCCLISMGIGFVVGSIVTANNRKILKAMRDAKTFAEDKIEDAKDGLEMLKEKMEEGENETKKSTQSKSKASK